MFRRLSVFAALAFLFVPAFAQDGEKYIVSDFATGTVYLFNVSDNQPSGSFQAGASPIMTAVAPGGRLLYVNNLNSDYLSVIDVTIGAEIRRVHGVSGRQMVMTSDGTLLAITSARNDEVYIVNTRDFSVQTVSYNGLICDDSTPQQCDGPGQQDQFTARGTAVIGHKLFVNMRRVGPAFAPRVMTLDLDSHVVGSIAGTAIGNLGGAGNRNMAATADGRYLVFLRLPGTIVVVDLSTNTVVQTSIANFSVREIAINAPTSPVAPTVYVGGVDLTSGQTQVIAYGLNGDGTLSALGSTPTGLPAIFSVALNSDGSRLYAVAGGAGQTGVFPGLGAVLDTAKIISDPAHAATQFSVGQGLVGVETGTLTFTRPTTAPSAMSVSPSFVVSNASSDSDRTLTITGSNFSGDALARVGNLDPLPTIPVTGGIQVTLPFGAAAQGASIIVTDPDLSGAITDRYESGILNSAFSIASPPTFQPVNQAVVTHFGDSSVAILNGGTNSNITSHTTGFPGAIWLALTPGGERAYIEEAFSISYAVLNLVTGQMENTIAFSTPATISAGGENITATVNPTGHPAQFTYFANSQAQDDGSILHTLYAIDADGSSPTLNTIVQQRTASLGFDVANGQDGGMAATSDGRFLFATFGDASSGSAPGDLVIYDIVGGSSTVIPMSSLGPAGMAGFQEHLEISSDNKNLLLADRQENIAVFDITTPMAPAYVTTIPGSAPTTNLPSNAVTYRIPRQMGSRLVVFDPAQFRVKVFNFDRSGGNYQQLGSFTIPAIPTNQYNPGIDVTPDGKLIYVVLTQEDAVAVLDTQKLIDGTGALLTKIVTGLSPQFVAVRPGTPTPAGASVTVQPIQQVTVDFGTVSSGGSTTVSTTNTSPVSAPAGFQLGTTPVYYEIQTTAVFSGNAVVCFTYDPATIGGPEADLRVAHYDTSITPAGWVDVTVLPVDTANHKICGQVSSFSPFVVGIGSTNYLFDSLVNSITNSGIQPSGEMKSLRAKALAARASFDKKNNSAAVNQLNALKSELTAQAGNPTVAAQTAYLTSLVNSIIQRLQ